MQAKLKNEREIVAALKRLQRLELDSSFDPVNPDSRPTPAQQEVFDDLGKVQYRWVVAGNQSGKSSMAAREIAWLLTDTHPTWTRPTEWGEEPLLILIAGQDRKQMEIELWTKKIKPFLDMSDWREVRVGGVLNFVEHKKAGHKVVFLSHNDSSDKNRQHMQGYVAHYVWLDEMPRSAAILEELQRRVDARKGYLIATFTPKFRNEDIRRVIDAAEYPLAKKYRLSKLDNPLYADRLTEEIQKLNGYAESYRNTILYGDWYVGDQAVYQFDYSMSVVPELPEFYSKSWRHVVSVDPAMKGKFGFTVWAEDPTNGIWFLINDEYLTNLLNPEEAVRRVAGLTAGYNIVRRICDPHESWFISQSAASRVSYVTPFNKTGRKDDLIKGLQYALSSGKIKIGAWCKTFIDEIQSCQYSETSDKIVSAQSYHTLDCAQYFVDLMPAYDETQRVLPWYQELREGNERRKKREREARIASQVSRGRVAKPVRAWGRNKFSVRGR